MWSFLAEFTRRHEGPVKVIVMDEEYREQPRHYSVHPRRVLWTLGGGTAALALLLASLLVFTPLRELIPGQGTHELRRDARLAAVRLAALQDSLVVQEQYVAQLQRLITGGAPVDSGVPSEPSVTVSGELAEVASEPITENWADHEQPALPFAQMAAEPDRALLARVQAAEERYLTSLQLPALPPVSGFLTGTFEPRTGHFAIDIAVEEGTMVRSIGDGYVILADWTHEGGYAVAVQHTDGFVSVYKHNQRLLKRVGDRVQGREAIAVSGNSGELTTGPHLHFELWHNGLAQDPSAYLVGL